MFRYVLMGTLVCYASCFTQISTLPVLKSRSVKDVCKMQKKDIDTRVFNDIDKDKSGSIDITELNSYYGKNNYMEVADINNDNMIDYPEFERLVKYAELELKEKELDVKEKISESQVKMASDNNS